MLRALSMMAALLPIIAAGELARAQNPAPIESRHTGPFAAATSGDASPSARPPSEDFLTPPPPRRTKTKRLAWYKKFQATVSIGVGVWSWGKIKPGTEFEAKVTQTFGAGFHFSGYYPVMEAVQVGAFMFYSPGLYKLVGEDKSAMHDGGLGTSIRIGARLGERLWLGGAIEIGLGFLTFDANNIEYEGTGFGLLLFPRFILDVLATRVGKTLIAATFSIGLPVFPVGKGNGTFLDLVNRNRISSRKFKYVSVRPILLVGLTFGK